MSLVFSDKQPSLEWRCVYTCSEKFRRKVAVEYQMSCSNFYSFKEGVILFCQSILETRRRISHLHGSALFTIPLIVDRKRIYSTVLQKMKRNHHVQFFSHPHAIQACFISNAFQKQPSEVFYKKRRSWKFCKIHRKTPVSEPPF